MDLSATILEELKKIGDRLGRLETRIDQFEQRMEVKLDHLMNEFRSTDKHLSSKYESQQAVIELLASRSVAQEAELKAIKRMMTGQ